MPIPPSSTRALLIICLCCACWAFGFGLECPLASLWMEDAGASRTLIGANTGTHFLGVLLLGAVAPAILRRGGRTGILLGLLASGIGVAAFPWGGGPAGWFALRLLAGAGGAVAMISLETMINWNAPPARRGRDFACYACAVGIGFALGSSIGLQVYAIDPRGSFMLGGLVTLAAIPFLFLLPAPPVVDEEPAAIGRWRPPFLSLGSSWSQGFLEVGLLALLPLYLRSVGMTDEASGMVLGGILVGVLLGQLPIGWLADHAGRERVLVGCFVLVGIALAFTPLAEHSEARLFWLAIVGIGSGAFYPLGLAMLGERVPTSQLPQANAWYLSVNCFGSLVSPLLTGPMMERYGPSAMFWVGEAVIVGVLLVWWVLRSRLFTFHRIRFRGSPKASRSA